MIRRAGLFGGTLGVALVASSSWPIVQGALAKDHGVMGQTWAIAEPDLLATSCGETQFSIKKKRE